MRLGGFAVLALTLIAGGCAAKQGTRQRDPNVLVRLADDEVKGLDPQKISDLASLRVATDQFEGLTRFSATGSVGPGLASAPSVSRDGLTWRYTLLPGLRFSDGHPITAGLFQAVLARLRAAETASPTKSLFDAIDTIAPESDRVVVVHLRHAFPAIGELLAHPAIAALPLHRAKWSEARPMVTSGPYRLSIWALNDHIILVPNPNWHQGRPPMAKIEWKPVGDTLSAMRLFEVGGADTTGDFPSARLKSLRTKLGSAVHVAPYRGAYYFAFNTRVPPFNDVRVRRALNLATDRKWIAGPMMDIGTLPAWGVVPPGTQGLAAFQPDWAAWSRERRMAEAARLLASAGYGLTHPLKFDIRFNSDTDHRRVSVALAAMWRPLGVEAGLFNSEAALHFASLKRADFALGRSGWIGDISVPENFLGVHRSDGGPINYSGYTNPSFDNALAAAEEEPNPQRRALAMRHAEAILMADAPVLPIYFYVSRGLVSPRVGGWQDNAANIHPSRTLFVKP
jgi:oligopeptide transport system substrate-binding protein